MFASNQSSMDYFWNHSASDGEENDGRGSKRVTESTAILTAWKISDLSHGNQSSNKKKSGFGSRGYGSLMDSSESDFTDSDVEQQKSSGMIQMLSNQKLSPTRIFTSMILIIFGIAAGVFLFSGKSGGTSITYHSSSSSETPTTSASGSSYESAYLAMADEPLSFTLTRDGYRALDYFSMDPSEIFKYKILDGYVAVIEPHVEMNLDVTSGVSEFLFYTYTVCPASEDALDSTCYSGSLSAAGGEAACKLSG